MENQVKPYVTAARANWNEVVAQVEAEFSKQEKRANRASETRLRTVLREIQKKVYVPYRDASLTDSKLNEGSEQ